MHRLMCGEVEVRGEKNGAKVREWLSEVEMAWNEVGECEGVKMVKEEFCA